MDPIPQESLIERIRRSEQLTREINRPAVSRYTRLWPSETDNQSLIPTQGSSMSRKYDYRDEEIHVTMLDLDGNSIGEVNTVEDAETLVSYLNAGEGGFTVAPLMENGKREYAFVSIDDTWVAYTRSEASAEAILSHLNRNS